MHLSQPEVSRKHALALMWQRAERKTAFAVGTAPEWAQDWARRRRTPSEENKESAGSASGNSIALASGEDAAEDNPKAEARAAAARERTRKDREEAIAAELEISTTGSRIKSRQDSRRFLRMRGRRAA